jgi:hypothetical protein
VVNSNDVTLYGGYNITVADTLFQYFQHLVSIDDSIGCIVALGTKAFYWSAIASVDLRGLVTLGTSALERTDVCTTYRLDSLTTVPDGSFYSCTSATSFYLPAVTSLGATVGDTFIFSGITGKTISLTVPSALMTVNGGNPDGDIQTLQANNTVTVTQV